jgi:serine/threonine protein kinase
MERIAHTLASTIRLMRNEKTMLKFDLIGYKNLWKSKGRKSKQYLEAYKENIFKRQDRIIQQLGSAIQYLHEHRIIHRDLKPENIGVDDEENVKLYDFGIAKELKEEDLVRDGQFKATGIVGTFRYMAPEVLNAQPYGKAADIYSLTLVIWHLLSMHVPFTGVHGKKNCNAGNAYKEIHKKGTRPKLKRDWSRELKSIIARGWNRDPLKRPSIDDYVVAIKKCEEFTF